jgi:hypothetical protein
MGTITCSLTLYNTYLALIKKKNIYIYIKKGVRDGVTGGLYKDHKGIRTKCFMLQLKIDSFIVSPMICV